VQDEPADVVFAGGKAFVSAGRRNQVSVFDQTNHAQLATVPLFGTDPRAMAVSVDGTKVYTALTLSGNHTTQIPAGTASNQPAPTNPTLPTPPKVSAIVDASDPNWTSVIHYRMPDNDVAEIDVASATLTRYFTNVGTVLLGIAVRPDNGDLYVANTDARNLVRFEPVLRGHLVDNRVTRINIGNGSRTFYDLNPGVDYGTVSNLVALTNALAIPAGIIFTPDGASFYVAAFGSDRVAHLDNNGNILARIEIGNAIGSSSDPRNKRGPRGLALNASAQRLYVINRISNTISIIDTSTDTVLKEIPVGSYDPTPAVIRNGRGFLYDTKVSGNGNASCATCHVDGDNDLIAWDLGDPGGNMKNVTLTLTNGQQFPGQEHPMKGPMMTQTLRGIIGNEPFHWRGDKTNFIDFDTTFNTLLGGATMNDPDMTAFRDFINTMTFAPNPNQNLDRTYPTNFPGGGNAQQGFTSFFNQQTACGTCIFCHSRPPGTGSTNAIRLSADDGTFQSFKQPHFRNLYQKVGFNRGTNVDSSVGFGFMHDGQEASIVTFLSRSFFGSIPAAVKTNLSAFLQCWDNGMAPAVGYSRTIVASNLTTASLTNDWNLLENQAAAGTNLDLIVKGTINGDRHGLLYQPGPGTYKPDTTNMPAMTRAQLAAKVQNGDTLTIMGVPLGSGPRMAVDRDLNGVLDADEPLPSLQISQLPGKVIVSWPLGPAGFNLQQAGGLDAVWADSTNPVQIVGSSNAVTNDPPASSPVYFRLRK
jgi:YVTN family beta-propeller protein